MNLPTHWLGLAGCGAAALASACAAARPDRCDGNTLVSDVSHQGSVVPDFTTETTRHDCVALGGVCREGNGTADCVDSPPEACVPDVSRCSPDGTRVQFCRRSGYWLTLEACANGCASAPDGSVGCR